MSSAQTMLLVPAGVNIKQYTNVQRGTIFIWFLLILLITIFTGLRICRKSSNQENKTQTTESAPESQRTFSKKDTAQNNGNRFQNIQAKINKINTFFLPLIITFMLNFTTGATYAFDLILFFITLTPLVLFNLLGLHNKMCSNRICFCIFENLWLIASFFWLINISTTKKYHQPGYIYQGKPQTI